MKPQGKRRKRMSAKEVKEIREQLGLSQTALAALMGVHRLSVVQWETGRKNVSSLAEHFLRHLESCPCLKREKK